MKNPKSLGCAFHTRFIVTSKELFGGGMDVTPSHEDKKDRLIHDALKNVCIKKKKLQIL